MYAHKTIAFVTLLFTIFTVHAGGPLILEGPAGQTPVKYTAGGSIIINFDIGTLGARSNAAADSIALDAFALLNSAATSTVLLTQGSDLNSDIDVSNFSAILPFSEQLPGGSTTSHTDNLNPFIYDDDGSIIEFLFPGQSDVIAGFAASIFLINGSEFLEGYAVMSGKIVLSDSSLRNLFSHEMGHFIGLDHAQRPDLNTEFPGPIDLNTCPGTSSLYPIMYPYLCRSQNSLHPDDTSAISYLYPSASANTVFGLLTGSFIAADGSSILGSNLWVEDTVNGDRFSVVSDLLKQCTGFFSLYLPPGTYELHAENIHAEFYDASSVGPYSQDMLDQSFQAPNNISSVDFAGTTPGSNEQFVITAGFAKNITFITDGSGTVGADTAIASAATNGIGTCPIALPGGGGGGYIRAESLVIVLLVFLLSARTRRRKE